MVKVVVAVKGVVKSRLGTMSSTTRISGEQEQTYAQTVATNSPIFCLVQLGLLALRQSNRAACTCTTARPLAAKRLAATAPTVDGWATATLAASRATTTASSIDTKSNVKALAPPRSSQVAWNKVKSRTVSTDQTSGVHFLARMQTCDI